MKNTEKAPLEKADCKHIAKQDRDGNCLGVNKDPPNLVLVLCFLAFWNII